MRVRSLVVGPLVTAVAAVAVAGLGTVGPVASPAHAATTLNLNYAQLNFNYANHVNFPAGGGSGTNCTGSNTCTGMADGDKVLFLGVATVDGVVIDGLVTTTLSGGATVTDYEVGTGAGSAADFTVNTNSGTGQYAAFTFEFYRSGTYGTVSPDAVTLQNVQMTGIDIDANQYNTFSDIQAYTLVPGPPGGNPPGGNLTATRTGGGTAFPGEYSFADTTNENCSSDPWCQVVVTFGSVTSTKVTMGKNASAAGNFFAVAMKALTFGAFPTTTPGASYTVSYDLNDGSGSTPASQSGNLGAIIVADSGSGISRTGYTLSGWNSVRGGTGQSATLGGPFTIPLNGATLFAQWAPDPYTVTYVDSLSDSGSVPAAQNFTVVAPATIAGNTGNLVRDGYAFAGWGTSPGGSVAYAPGAVYGSAANLTLYPIWTPDGPAPAPPCTLSYSANGGLGAIASATTSCGSWIATNAGNGVSRDGFRLSGWGTAPAGGTVFAPGASVLLIEDTLLYARWLPVGAGPERSPAPSGLEPSQVLTDAGTPVTVDPLRGNPPPPGQEWVVSSMRIIDPVTQEAGTKVVTPQGTWRLDTVTGAVSFTPRAGFVGKASVEFQLLSSASISFRSLVTVQVLPAGTRAASLDKVRATVYFGIRSAVLTPAAKHRLDALVRRASQRGQEVRASVVGFVQPERFRGNDGSLSAARARAVKEYLRSKGIDDVVEWKGVGRADQPDWVARRATATIWVKRG